jgi:hypothetical protein
MADDAEIYHRIIQQTDEKQVRLVINLFRDIEYIHLREYYLDFEGEWCPTPKGVAMALTLDNTRELFAGLLEILSLGESKELITEHFKDLIEETYS